MTILSPAESLLGILRSTRTLLMDAFPAAASSAPSLEELKRALGRSINELTAATSRGKPVAMDGNGRHSRHWQFEIPVVQGHVLPLYVCGLHWIQPNTSMP
jgi:hypothetical protein